MLKKVITVLWHIFITCSTLFLYLYLSESFIFHPSSCLGPESTAAVTVCMDLNRHTSLPKVPASWTQGPWHFVVSAVVFTDLIPSATLQFLLENLMRQQEHWAAGGVGGGLLHRRDLWVVRSTASLPVTSSHCRACPRAWLCGLGPFAVALHVCSCWRVIRCSHCRTAPSHLQGGSEGCTALVFVLATLDLGSRKEREWWNSIRLLMINIKSITAKHCTKHHGCVCNKINGCGYL